MQAQAQSAATQATVEATITPYLAVLQLAEARR